MRQTATTMMILLVCLSRLSPADNTGASNGGEAFRLVDGDAQAVIVGNDDLVACVENGYTAIPALLRTYIEKSTGRALRKIKEAEYDPATMPYAIFCPDTRASRQRHADRLATLDRDSYVVEITPAAVYLAGARAHSGGYAMLDFLERTMGIATYIPSRWGTIVPRHDKVVLEPELCVESPVFTSRAISCVRSYHDTDKINYSATGDLPWRLYRRDKFHHAVHQFITVEEFGKTHPEYFPEVNGKRVIVSTGTGPGPCISNPDVVRIVSEKVVAFFDDPGNVEEDTISLGMTDGGWCECANCQALDGLDTNGERTRSRRYYTFLNQVGQALAKKHPGKSIGVLAYAGAEYPPADLELSRNVVPYICQTRANWGDPAVREAHLKQTRDWATRVDRIGVYEYLYGAGFMVPRIYHQQLADYLRSVKANGDAGIYAEMYSNHALDGPKAWVSEKLFWNPHQDPAALQTTWCQRVFEEAAEPMDRYFAFLEQCNTRNIARCEPGRRGRASKFFMLQDETQFNLFTVEETQQAKALLAEATAATERPEIRKRIGFFAEGLDVAEMSIRAYHSFNKAKMLAEQSKPDEQILAALIDGEANSPTVDPILLMQEAVAKDASSFTPVMPVAVSTSTELSVRLVNNRAWGAVHQLITAGERDRDKLVDAAQAELLKIAPSSWRSDPLAKRRVEMLLAMCDRVAVAHATSDAPIIDGNVSDRAWRWTSQQPWWQWKSGLDYEEKTEVAFCHAGNTLYVAYRCWQNDVGKFKLLSGYGAPAWKTLGMELHLNPDERNAASPPPKHYLAVASIGDGLYSNTHEVVKQWKVTHADDHWQAELAIDLDKLGMTPSRFPALRMNLIRNTGENGHYGKGWFPSFDAHKDPAARGWLVFE